MQSLTTGCIEYTRDWSDNEVPAVRLVGEGGKRVFQSFERAPRYAAAGRYGYFVNDDGALVFAVRREAHSENEIYVAGDFNGWSEAIGDEKWKMTAGELAGEPMWLWVGLPDQFWAESSICFKFVTGENQWLVVPDDSPNSVRDDKGLVNHVLDPQRTGSQFFQYELEAPLDLAHAWRVERASDEENGVVLQPGDFFFSINTKLPMGATIEGDRTIFRLFAPRASEVSLHLSQKVSEGAANQVIAMQRNTDEPYVWETICDSNMHEWYYWYQLDGVSDKSGAFDPNFRVLDPFALATVCRDGPGIVIDRSTLGLGDRSFATPDWQDLIMAEAHVRDLAAKAPIKATPRERRGFTGLRKWVESPEFYLHHLGVNCVELQPIQEFDNESREEYHWGYMTVNWFSPASAYAMEPEKASGISEFQELVAAFHRRGMAVVLDVVYNHVGVPAHLHFIDKLYYFEQDADGALSNWSGCGNDIRADAAMAKRLIIESCTHLIETYGVDGFRFDLAELLGAEVLIEIEDALKQVKRNVILIAEPWSFRGHIAGVLRDTGWSSWNDGYRDFLREYVRGGSKVETFEYYLKGAPWYWSKWPAQTVNFSESHDDRCWLDVITENPDHNGNAPTANDRRRTHLMAAILFSSIGIPMLAAGQDFMRSKHGVNNTYQRGDLNALDFRRLLKFSGTHAYFADWIAFRRSDQGKLLRLWSAPEESYFHFCNVEHSTACAVVYNFDASRGFTRLLFAVNPTLEDVVLPLGDEVTSLGEWRQLADHDRFFPGYAARQSIETEVYLPALGCGLWICGG